MTCHTAETDIIRIFILQIRDFTSRRSFVFIQLWLKELLIVSLMKLVDFTDGQYSPMTMVTFNRRSTFAIVVRLLDIISSHI